MATSGRVWVRMKKSANKNSVMNMVLFLLAPGPATLVAQAPPAVANILNVRVQVAMCGKTEAVKF